MKAFYINTKRPRRTVVRITMVVLSTHGLISIVDCRQNIFTN